MGALFFRHRLAVIVGFFLAAVVVAAAASRAPASPLAVSLADLIGLERAFVPAGTLCLVAFGLRAWGEAQLGAAVYGQEAAPRVVSSGPFRWMRHPLYAGTWLFFVASVAPYVPVPFLAFAALAFGAALRAIAVHEEEHLEARHGDAWRAYARAVPRFIGVPRAVKDDGVTAHGSAWAAATLSNLGMASLGVYRLLVASGLSFRGLATLNLACLVVWLAVVVVRRARGR